MRLVLSVSLRGGQRHLASVGTILTVTPPAFMAPEMINDGDGVGPSADVYALGCVAYWLLTGKFVFDARNPTAMLLRHLQTPPQAPSASASHAIPAELDRLILRDNGEPVPATLTA